MPPKSSYRPRPGPGALDDGWRSYNGLVDMGYKKHFRVRHGEHEFARGNFHIDGIESFWSYAKRRLAKFNVFPDKRSFYTSRNVNSDLITEKKISL